MEGEHYRVLPELFTGRQTKERQGNSPPYPPWDFSKIKVKEEFYFIFKEPLPFLAGVINISSCKREPET